MENLYNCDGRRYSAIIEKVYCEGIISVENNIVYLCQNKKKGLGCCDRKGFTYSWWYRGPGGTINISVTNFHLLEEEFKEGDQIYVSNTDPECNDKDKKIFLYKSKTGINVTVSSSDNKAYLRGEIFRAIGWKYIKPIPKEIITEITEITVEEALEIVAKQKGISIEKLRLKK